MRGTPGVHQEGTMCDVRILQQGQMTQDPGILLWMTGGLGTPHRFQIGGEEGIGLQRWQQSNKKVFLGQILEPKCLL